MKNFREIFFTVLSVIAFYIVNKISFCFINFPLDNMFESKIIEELENINIHTGKAELIAGGIAVICVWFMYLYNKYTRKNFLENKEHGSAEWGTEKDIIDFQDKEENKNILLTQTEKFSINTRKTFRNNNVLTIGGSGSGKTRFFVKPNIMQMNSSYVITDPKEEILKSTGKMLEENGYEVKVFDLITLKNTHKYNFFEYLNDEKDILKIANNIIMNTTPPHSKNAGDFWEKAENALLQALIAYVFFEGLEEEKNISTVMDLLRLADVKEEDEDYESPLDILFNDLKKENENHFAVKQYEIYKKAAGKTAKSILISVGVRLAPFNINDVADITREDTLELEKIGDKKTALFILISDSDTTLNFLVAIMYQQLLDTLFYRADNIYNGSLPYNVMFVLDEFANIGQIPNFQIYISTMRSRKISVMIILQNLNQLKNLYKNSWETITGNCDSLLFLGGKEQSTLKYISETIGKTTIDYKSISENRGTNGSYSVGNQIIARDLITPAEVGLLKSEECILTIRGIKPFKSKKYDIEKHKNYKLLSDSNNKNIYKRKINETKEINVLNEIEKIKEIKEIELED